MSRPKGIKNSPDSKCPGGSLSDFKTKNQQLREDGLRRCKVCGEIKELDKFRVIKYRVDTSGRKSNPVYSATCVDCEAK